MSLLSDFFISSETDVPSYDGDPTFPDHDRVQLNHITPLEAAGLLEALRGGGDSVEMISDFPLLTPQDAETWTMGIPDDFVTRLAELDESAIRSTATSFAEITVEELGWPVEDAASMVAGPPCRGRWEADVSLEQPLTETQKGEQGADGQPPLALLFSMLYLHSTSTPRSTQAPASGVAIA